MNPRVKRSDITPSANGIRGRSRPGADRSWSPRRLTTSGMRRLREDRPFNAHHARGSLPDLESGHARPGQKRKSSRTRRSGITVVRGIRTKRGPARDLSTETDHSRYAGAMHVKYSRTSPWQPGGRSARASSHRDQETTVVEDRRGKGYLFAPGSSVLSKTCAGSLYAPSSRIFALPLDPDRTFHPGLSTFMPTALWARGARRKSYLGTTAPIFRKTRPCALIEPPGQRGRLTANTRCDDPRAPTPGRPTGAQFGDHGKTTPPAQDIDIPPACRKPACKENGEKTHPDGPCRNGVSRLHFQGNAFSILRSEYTVRKNGKTARQTDLNPFGFRGWSGLPTPKWARQRQDTDKSEAQNSPFLGCDPASTPPVASHPDDRFPLKTPTHAEKPRREHSTPVAPRPIAPMAHGCACDSQEGAEDEVVNTSRSGTRSHGFQGHVDGASGTSKTRMLSDSHASWPPLHVWDPIPLDRSPSPWQV